MAKKKTEKEWDYNGELEGKKDLYKLSYKLDLQRHELRMKELEFLRESDRLHHERELERNRIKSAEIRKSQMRKEAGSYKY